MTVDFSRGTWLNQPQHSTVTPQKVTITTDMETDFWQRSYYGFRNDNAPALAARAACSFL